MSNLRFCPYCHARLEGVLNRETGETDWECPECDYKEEG
jgi:hypothetical protein